MLFALADGLALRMLSEPDRDWGPTVDAGALAVRQLILPVCDASHLDWLTSQSIFRAMQTLMMRLDAIVRRRRGWVLAAWLVLLVASVPLAAKQSDHLSSGGFGVPGSQSQAVADAMATIDGVERTSLSIVLVGSAASSTGDPRGRPRRSTASPASASPSPRATSPSSRCRSNASDDDATDVAVDLREALGVGSNGVHLAGQGALWAGLQEVSKHDLEKAEQTGFPIVLLILLAVFGSLAAAALPLALGFGSRRSSPAR